MGISITKYDDAKSGNVRFDYSKFDYFYDNDTFPATTAEDFSDIIDDHGKTYTITRQTTTEDSMGRVLSVSNTNFDVTAILRAITLKDRKIHDMGLAVPGNRKFYFKPSYTVSSVEYEIKEGDIVTDANLYSGTNTGEWRIVKILKQWYLPNQKVYGTAIVKNINLDGTE